MKVGINQNRTFYNLSCTNTSIHRHFQNIIHNIFNLRDTEVVVCINNSIKKSRWPQQLFKNYSTLNQNLIASSIIRHLYATVGNLNIWRKPPTCYKSTTLFITQGSMDYTTTMNGNQAYNISGERY